MKRELTIKKLQRILGVKADGIWGPVSQRALERLVRSDGSAVKAAVARGKVRAEKQTEEISAVASSFADPADLAAFRRCKGTGKTDLQCFKVGDNGIGQFGKITAQMHTPMAALHADDMKAKWGSVAAAAHRKVKVTVGRKSVIASVEDRLGVKGRIDLNPAAAKALGLKPPFLVKCTWSWA
jgi:chaperone required for assembly of F1-ATPase